MLNNPKQLEFPYASLDFPNRATLRPVEIATRLGCSKRHIENLIEEGELGDLDIAAKGKKWSVVPIEEYRNFILKKMSGMSRSEFLTHLPTAALNQLLEEIHAILTKRKKFG